MTVIVVLLVLFAILMAGCLAVVGGTLVMRSGSSGKALADQAQALPILLVSAF